MIPFDVIGYNDIFNRFQFILQLIIIDSMDSGDEFENDLQPNMKKVLHQFLICSKAQLC